MFLSGVVLVVLRLREWVSAAASPPDLRHAFVVLAIILAVPAAASVWPFAKAGASDAEDFALSLAKDKGGAASERTLDLRLYLWQQALEKGLSHGSFGLGPGPHLDPPPQLTRDSESSNDSFEAHNTPLDVFLQAGILGVALFGGLLVSTALPLYRRRMDALLTFLIALAVFCNAHFVLRHPVVWFALSLSVSAACSPPYFDSSARSNARG
jgi:O-antigen ligase